MEDRLAAALACFLSQEVRDELRSSRVPASRVLELFEFDHIELHALDGSDLWYNLDPKIVAAHREKSRRDTSIVAKVKRITREQEEFQRRILAKAEGKAKPKSKWGKRKMQSRPFKRVAS